MTKDPYTILPIAQADFNVGTTNNGRQVILGVLFSDIVAYMFDSDGRLISRECHPWRTPELPYLMSFQQSQDPKLRIGIDHQLSKLLRQLDFKEEPITIEEFYDEDLFVGIQRIPTYLQQAAEKETQTEYEERCSERRDWIESGKFVFWWARDYWCFNGGRNTSAKQSAR